MQKLNQKMKKIVTELKFHKDHCITRSVCDNRRKLIAYRTLMTSAQLQKTILDALEEYKGLDIVNLDIREYPSITDYLVICSGTSKRHVQSLAENVVAKAKTAGFNPIGMEGQEFGEWVLIDLVDVVVHVMLPQVREFYSLEKLWSTTQEFRKANEN